jgi:hypothetical protein
LKGAIEREATTYATIFDAVVRRLGGPFYSSNTKDDNVVRVIEPTRLGPSDLKEISTSIYIRLDRSGALK